MSFRKAARIARWYARWLEPENIGSIVVTRKDSFFLRKRFPNIRYRIFRLSAHELQRWNYRTDACRLTVVVATYRQEDALGCLLQSLVCQTLQNFRVLVIHDGPSASTEALVRQFKPSFPNGVEVICTPERFDDYGHSLREEGIKLSRTEFLLITNGDNYYAPRFVEFMFEAIDQLGLDVVFCDLVHSHYLPHLGSYRRLRTRPLRRFIDIGCFFVRTETAKKVGFRDKSFFGDATFFEDVLRTPETRALGKVEKVLMVHN